MPSLLEVHEKTVDFEEDGNVQDQDSKDDDVKETEEGIEKKAVAVKIVDEDKAGTAAAKVEYEPSGPWNCSKIGGRSCLC